MDQQQEIQEMTCKHYKAMIQTLWITCNILTQTLWPTVTFQNYAQKTYVNILQVKLKIKSIEFHATNIH